jgi:hypothetical protein
MKLPLPAEKTIDRQGRLIKDRVQKAILDRQNALHELLNAIQGTDYAHAVLESNKTIDHACIRKTQALGNGHFS